MSVYEMALNYVQWWTLY